MTTGRRRNGVNSSVVLTEKGVTQGETKVFVIDRALFVGIQEEELTGRWWWW